MPPTLRTTLLALSFTLPLAACDEPSMRREEPAAPRPGDPGDPTPGDPDDPTDDPGGDDATDDEVDLVCDLVERACERQVACGHPVLNGAPDLEGCLATQRCELVADLLGAPSIELDRGALSVCAEAIESASCGALASLGLGVDPSCTQYVAGTLGEGEACRGGTVSDCAPGLTCDLTEERCPGTCVAPVAACAEGSCGPSAFCAADGACRPRAALGEACDPTQLDFDNLRDDPCLAGSHCTEGICQANLAAGAACDGADVHACGPDLACRCEGSPDCAPDRLACRPAVEEGGACRMAFDCAAGLHCDLTRGVCAARGGRGDACTMDLGSCAHPLDCVDGRCGDAEGLAPETPLLEEGESCRGGGSCPLGTACTCDGPDCAELRCLPAPRLGESCARQLEASLDPVACAEGVCDVYGSKTCVLPGDAGAPCAPDGLTLACASLVCAAGTCTSFEETRCEPR